MANELEQELERLKRSFLTELLAYAKIAQHFREVWGNLADVAYVPGSDMVTIEVKASGHNALKNALASVRRALGSEVKAARIRGKGYRAIRASFGDLKIYIYKTEEIKNGK